MPIAVLAVFAGLIGPVGAARAGEPRHQVELMTFSSGEHLFTSFGHTVVRIIDRERGTDQSYDWGTYDSSDPYLAPKFLVGKLQYWMDSQTTARALRRYEHQFGGAVSQELFLSVSEVALLLEHIQQGLQPENRYYAYHHFVDNCTTRVRDLFDDILGGALREATEGHPADGDTYRKLINAAMPTAPVARWLVYGLLNGLIDVPLDRWQRMFLPAYLMDELDKLMIETPSGEIVPVVSRRERLFGRAPAVPYPAPSLLPWVVLVIGVLFATGWPGLVPRSRVGRIATGIVTTLWGLFGGFYGAIMVLGWCVAPYPETKANLNLVAAHPLLLALVVLGPLVACGRPRAGRIVRSFLLLQGAVLLVALAARGLGLFVQQLEGFALPALMAVAGTWWSLSRQRTAGS